jgi:hypothetical protein
MGGLLDLALNAAPGASPSPAAVRRQRRINKAIRMLAEVPARRAAYIAGAEVDSAIPVTVVISTAQGLVTGELVIPRARWSTWVFLQFLGGVGSA